MSILGYVPSLVLRLTSSCSCINSFRTGRVPCIWLCLFLSLSVPLSLSPSLILIIRPLRLSFRLPLLRPVLLPPLLLLSLFLPPLPPIPLSLLRLLRLLALLLLLFLPSLPLSCYIVARTFFLSVLPSFCLLDVGAFLEDEEQGLTASCFMILLEP